MKNFKKKNWSLIWAPCKLVPITDGYAPDLNSPATFGVDIRNNKKVDMSLYDGCKCSSSLISTVTKCLNSSSGWDKCSITVLSN